jgi:hypothetical protein
VVHFRLNFENLCIEFVETNWIFEFLLEKHPISKTSRLKRSPGSEVIIILKSVSFQGFYGNTRVICRLDIFGIKCSDFNEVQCHYMYILTMEFYNCFHDI